MIGCCYVNNKQIKYILLNIYIWSDVRYSVLYYSNISHTNKSRNIKKSKPFCFSITNLINENLTFESNIKCDPVSLVS